MSGELDEFSRNRSRNAPRPLLEISGAPSGQGQGATGLDLAALVGELIVKSPDFGRLWERYEVREMGDGQKIFYHPQVGTMTLGLEVLDLNRTDGQRMVVYMASRGTPDHDAMALLDMSDFQSPERAVVPVSPSA